MTIEVGINSFASLEQAEAFFSSRFGSEAWDNASDTDKEKALLTATRQINALPFIGCKTLYEQPLEFPRMLEYVSQIPDKIVFGTCEQALYLLEGESEHAKNKRDGIKSASMGRESVAYDDTRFDMFCYNARYYFGDYVKKGFYFEAESKQFGAWNNV